MTSALLLTLVLGFQTSDTAIFSDRDLGLSFTHPKSWTVGRKSRGETRIEIPLENSRQPALLFVSATQFNRPAEVWQEIQQQINVQLRREVDRQWQQDVLGVPMLLTQSSYLDRGETMASLTGLLYSRTYRKMLIRLVAPKSSMDEALFKLNSALETLRTDDGASLTAEDPTQPPVAAPVRRPPPPTRTQIGVSAQARPAVVPPQSAELAFGSQVFILRTPQGWSVRRQGDSYELAHPDVTGVASAVFQPASVEPAGVALRRIAAETLAEFAKVQLRTESPGSPNEAGGSALWIARRGQTAAGAFLYALDGTIAMPGNYLIVRYRLSDAASLAKSERALLALFAGSRLEPKP